MIKIFLLCSNAIWTELYRNPYKYKINCFELFGVTSNVNLIILLPQQYNRGEITYYEMVFIVADVEIDSSHKTMLILIQGMRKSNNYASEYIFCLK